MTSRSTSWRVTALAIGVAMAIAGCGSSDDGRKEPTASSEKPSASTTIAPDVPSGYNTCNDIPSGVLDSEKLRNRGQADSNASGGIKWRGCRYGRTDGYVAAITTTNLTVAMTKQKNFPDAREFDLNGRAAIATRQVKDHPEAACVVNVEMKGGSLDISLSNPPSNKETGQIDSCELARNLAAKIVPTIPTGV